MAKPKRSKEEIQAFYAEMRQKWQEAKQLAETSEIKAVYQEIHRMGIPDISLGNVAMVFMQAQALGFDGLPYIDFKTYNAWRESGFQVEKGEKSQVITITWISKPGEEGEADDDDAPRWPKATYLFHRSQVKPIIQ